MFPLLTRLGYEIRHCALSYGTKEIYVWPSVERPHNSRSIMLCAETHSATSHSIGRIIGQSTSIHAFLAIEKTLGALKIGLKKKKLYSIQIMASDYSHCIDRRGVKMITVSNMHILTLVRAKATAGIGLDVLSNSVQHIVWPALNLSFF